MSRLKINLTRYILQMLPPPWARQLARNIDANETLIDRVFDALQLFQQPSNRLHRPQRDSFSSSAPSISISDARRLLISLLYPDGDAPTFDVDLDPAPLSAQGGPSKVVRGTRTSGQPRLEEVPTSSSERTVRKERRKNKPLPTLPQPSSLPVSTPSEPRSRPTRPPLVLRKTDPPPYRPSVADDAAEGEDQPPKGRVVIEDSTRPVPKPSDRVKFTLVSRLRT